LCRWGYRADSRDRGGGEADRAEVKIIGDAAERAPSYYLSWKEGKVVGTETCDTMPMGWRRERRRRRMCAI